MFQWKRLHRGLKAIFFIQMVNRAGDFVIPFLTLLLTQVQHLPPVTAGVLVTATSALGGLGALAAGRLGDRFSRRTVLLGFLGTSAGLLAAAGFDPGAPWATVAMMASGFFVGGMRPVLNALVADLAEPETRRSAFSLSYLGINIGVSVGPLAAGWLFGHALGWLFWLDALSTVVALGLLMAFVPRQTRPGGAVPTAAASVLAAFARHRVLGPYFVLALVSSWAYAQTIFSEALQLVDLFGSNGPGVFGAVWAVNGLTVVAATPLVLHLTRRWTNLASMAAGQLMIAAGLAFFLAQPGVVLVLVSTGLWSLGEVFYSVHQGDLVTTQSPEAYRAQFQSYTGFANVLGFTLAPVTSGLITSALGLPALWWLATAAAAAAGVGLALLERRVRRQPS